MRDKTMSRLLKQGTINKDDVIDTGEVIGLYKVKCNNCNKVVTISDGDQFMPCCGCSRC